MAVATPPMAAMLKLQLTTTMINSLPSDFDTNQSRVTASPSGLHLSQGLGVRPHDLPHTFVTRMLDLSVPIEQANYLAGHKSMAMTKRYDHAN